MKLISTLLATLYLSSQACSHTANDLQLEDIDLSLPDLEHLDLLDAPTWKTSNDVKFTGGRIILTPAANTKSSITNDIELAYDSWTIETIFRSVNSIGKTQSGLSLKYVKDHDSSDTSFFGSSSKFDGLNVLVDADSELGASIHVFLDDGKVDFNKLRQDGKLYDQAIGSCLLSYQDSQVPNTLRISNYAGSLLVQINNQICLKTKKVKLAQNYKIGLSASTQSQHEQFEILRFKTYGGVLSEIVENDGKAAQQPNVVTKVVKLDDVKSSKDTTEKSTQKSIDQTSTNQDISQYLKLIDQVKNSNNDILESFGTLQAKVDSISAISKDGKQVDFSFLEEHSKKIKTLIDHVILLEDQIKEISTRFTNFENNIRSELNTLVSSVNKLNNDNINQLRDNEHSIDELNQSIKFLVLSEKERQENPISDAIGVLKYLIFPVIIFTAALSFFTYRLRHEIKTKLL